MNHKNHIFRHGSTDLLKPKRKNYLSIQAGLTLIEVIVSLAILSAATIGMSMVADQYSQDTKGSVTASQLRTFGEASKAYIKDNYAAIQAVATATAPALIDVPTLITAGKLPPGFLATNAFGQSMCTLVLLPAANRLQAMVVTEGGTAIEDLALGTIAATVGGSGGGVYSSDAAIMRGAIGGWSLTTSTYDNLANNVTRRCDGSAGNVQVTAGHPLMALWFENGDTSTAFLSRDAVPGKPQLNQMGTGLDMNGNAINNASQVNTGILGATGNATIGGTIVVTGTATAGNLTTAGTATAGKVQVNDVVTENDACGSNGLVGKNAAGLLLSCQSGGNVGDSCSPVGSKGVALGTGAALVCQ